MQMIEQNPFFQSGDGASQQSQAGDTAVALPSSQASMMSSSTSAQLQIPSLWNSQTDFYKSLDNFLDKLRSTDSFQKRMMACGDGDGKDMESLREFLVSRSLAFDSTMSQEWVPHYEDNHEEVNPKTVFTHSQLSQLSQEDDEHEAIAPASQNSTATTTDWGAMFRQGLPSYGAAAAKPATSAPLAPMIPSWATASSSTMTTPLGTLKSVKSEPSTAERDAADALAGASKLVRPALPLPPLPKTPSVVPSSSQLRDSDSPSGHSSNGGSDGHSTSAKTPQRRNGSTAAISNNKRKRPSVRSKRDPAVKRFYNPTDADVLCGRGGRTNHHPGNKLYLRLKEEIQDRYLAASKNDKTAISQELVDGIHKRGGRFLEQDDATGDWFEITAVKARKKASQTLRELNTPEERKAKRERYGK